MPGLATFFFFNDTATTEIYTLSLHDALPICFRSMPPNLQHPTNHDEALYANKAGSYSKGLPHNRDRKSTRLNSSHSQISYAVFCLKKKKDTTTIRERDSRLRYTFNLHRVMQL